MGSTFNPMLGYFKTNKIGAHNWGFVFGKVLGPSLSLLPPLLLYSLRDLIGNPV